jgi:hypothetical protein
MKKQRPWLLTARCNDLRVTIEQFETRPQANIARGVVEKLPVAGYFDLAVELNPEFKGPFPIVIHTATSIRGRRGFALCQYNRHSNRDEYVSPIFTGRWGFRDVVKLRNEVEAELKAAAGVQA